MMTTSVNIMKFGLEASGCSAGGLAFSTDVNFAQNEHALLVNRHRSNGILASQQTTCKTSVDASSLAVLIYRQAQDISR